MKKLLFLVIATAFLGFGVSAQTPYEFYNKGIKSYNSREFDDAFRYFTKAKEGGCNDAYWYLAICYLRGEGVAKNKEKYLEIIDEGASKGCSRCISFLNEENPSKAFEYRLKWAECGDRWQQMDLAECYKKGVGVQKDLRMSALWYKIAYLNFLQYSPEENLATLPWASDYKKECLKNTKALEKKGYVVTDEEATAYFNQVAQKMNPEEGKESYPTGGEKYNTEEVSTALAVKTPAPQVKKSDVDVAIPETGRVASNTFAVVIANENYLSLSKVDYAVNDGKVFAEYCKKTLGIPEKHVMSWMDATYGTMERALSKIEQIGQAYDGKLNIIFYYSGHGIPDEKTRDAYIIPTDGDGSALSTCIRTSTLYKRLAAIGAESTVVLMDACFSGSVRGDGMLASARGVRLAPKEETIGGKMVIISAATGDQTAYPYADKCHGLFTYYLLKKLQSTAGNATLGELTDYVQSEVRKGSIVNCDRLQTPTVISSLEASDWKEWKF